MHTLEVRLAFIQPREGIRLAVIARKVEFVSTRVAIVAIVTVVEAITTATTFGVIGLRSRARQVLGFQLVIDFHAH